MVYFQRNVPPPNKMLNFAIKDFSGGLNNNSNQQAYNEASDLMNMAFHDDTLLSRRFGITPYNAWTHNGDVTYMYEFAPYTGNSKLITATNTKLYADGVEVATLAGKVNGIGYMGKFVFVDGSKIRVYGQFPQASSGNEVIVGAPIATYTVLEMVNPPAGFTPAPTPATRGKWNYDYTNKKVWYEPCNAEVVDTYKGSNVLPDSPKYVEVHGGRLFLSGSNVDDDNVFISDINNGFYFPVFLPIQLPPNGDQIMGMKVFQDSVVIGRKNDVHVIYGNTNRTDLNAALFRLKKVNTHTGFAGQDSATLVNNYLFYLGYDGNMYAMNSTNTNVDLLSTSILNKKVNLFKHPISITSADLPAAKAIYFNDEWLVSIKDKVIVYSYRHRAFTVYDYTLLNVTSFLVKEYGLLMGTNTGVIVKPSQDYMDVGKPYGSYWKSKNFDMEDSASFKQFREFFIVAHTFDGFSSDIDFTFEVDYVDIKEQHTAPNEISIWGKSKWGDRFISRNVVASLPIVVGRRGRNIRVIFSCGHTPSAPVATFSDLNGYPGLVYGTLVYVTDENKYYLFMDNVWTEQKTEMMNQPMLVYEVNGAYEIRGKR